MKWRNIIILMFVFSNSVALAEGELLRDPRATKKFTEQVVELIAQDKLDEAFAQLKPHWPMAEGELDTLLLHTKKQRALANARFGQAIGLEFIRTESVGTSLVRYTYLEKFQHHALRWQFSYYRTSNHWEINSVYWDDEISQLY